MIIGLRELLVLSLPRHITIGDENDRRMASRVDLPSLPPFDPVSDPANVGKDGSERFETYLVAVGVTNNAQKRALLLYQVGSTTQEIFDALPETGHDYETAMTKLNEYFTPKKKHRLRNISIQASQAKMREKLLTSMSPD